MFAIGWMRLQNSMRLWSAMFLLLAMILPGPIYAAKKKVKHDRQFLNLTVALEEEVKLDFFPDGAKLKGDYRKVTEIQVSPDTKTLKFNPKSTGTATLTIHDKKGRMIYEYLITVRKSDLNKIAKELRTLLADVEGIDIKIVHDKVIVDGQVLLPADMNRIATVVGEYKAQAASFVTISPAAQRKIAEIIERDINNPEIHVRAVNDKFILEGVAADKNEAGRAEIIAKTYVPDPVSTKDGAPAQKRRGDLVVINLIQIRAAPPPEPGKIIQLVIHYVELNKDYNKGFRFQWTPTISDDTGIKFDMTNSSSGGNTVMSQLTGVISNLLPKLNWAKEHGHARILHSQSVLAQDGEKGLVSAGQEISYPIIGPGGQPSSGKAFAGIKSDITPHLIGPNSDSIKLDITFEVSSLTGMTPSGPMISKNNVESHVVVRSGESAAIGGLVSNASGTDYNKLPKDIANESPLISLYASKSFRRNQTQFVVFVTPIIKSSASAGSDRIKSKFRLRD